MIDILTGDLLTVDGVDYSVRGVDVWSRPMSTTMFNRLAVVTASTKRNPGIVNGKRGDPATHIESIKITPLDSLSPDQVRYRTDLKSPFKVFETFVADENQYLHLLVEDLR